MNTKVSVIIPAFNTEKYIKRAIVSVISQTHENVEIIVVDDASTDGTVDVIKRIKDPRLTLICLPQNVGAAAARNRALQQATGHWIAVLDSDDWYAPERLDRLLTFASQKQADMVADDLYIIEDGESEPRTTIFKYNDPSITVPFEIDSASFVLSDIEGKKGLALGYTCLLYTSPSPRDATLSRMPSSA